MNEPKRKSWRSSSTTGARPSPQRGFRTDTTTGRPLLSSQQTKFLIALIGFLGLVAAFVVAIIRAPKSVPLYAFEVTTYPIHIPPNALAREDVERMAQQTESAADITFHWNTKDDDGAIGAPVFKKRLKDFLQDRNTTPGGPTRSSLWRSKGAMIFYISAHGVVNKNGEPCLLLSDSKPWDCRTWFRIQELFETINDSLKPNVKKLVILDSGKLLEEWGVGVFHNGFAELLDDLLLDDKNRRNNFFVLNSTRNNQRSHLAPELGGSVFGYFATLGLLGSADAEEFGGDGDAKVSLQEFSDFMAHQVDHWVQLNRADNQQPILLPNLDAGQKGFGIAYVSGVRSIETVTAAETVLQTARKRQQQISGNSLDFAKLERDGAYRFDPIRWANLQHFLKRANQLVFAGKSYDDQFGNVLNRINNFIDELKNPKQIVPSAASLALQENLPRRATSEARQEAIQAVQELWKEYLKTNHEDQKAKLKSVVYEDLALASWNWLVNPEFQSQLSDPDRLYDSLAKLAEIPDIVMDEPELESTEIHFASILQKCIDWQMPPNLKPTMGEVCLSLLTTRNELEQLAAPIDPRVHYWLVDTLRDADAACNAALDSLLIGSEDELNQARSKLIECQTHLNRVRTIHDEVRDAYLFRDKASAMLPHLWSWLISARNTTSELSLGEWKNLADGLVQLSTGVRALNEKLAGDVRELGGKIAERNTPVLVDMETTQAMKLVESRFREWSAELAERSEGGTAEIRRSLARMEVPLTAETEVEIFESLKIQETIGLNLIKALQSAASKTPILKVREQLGELATTDDSYYEWLATQSKHPALFSADLDAHRMGENRRDRLRSWAMSGGDLRTKLQSISNEKYNLEALLSASLPDVEPSKTTARTKLSQADQDIRRVASSLLSDNDGPSEKLWRLDASFLLLQHATRRLDDFWGYPENTKRFYFYDAAIAHIQAANDCLSRVEKNPFSESKTAVAETENLARQNWVPFTMKDIKGSQTGDKELNHQVELQANKAIPEGDAAFYLRSLATNALLPLDVDGTPIRRRKAKVSSRSASDSRLSHKLAINIKDVREFEAVAIYRGHKIRRPLQKKRGVLVQFADAGPSKIKVIGELNGFDRYEVVFVLDCSFSMDPEQRQTGLFGPMKRGLMSFLPALENEQVRAGLVCYGHRSYFKDDNGKFYRKGQTEIHPGDDVESVFTLGRVNANSWSNRINDLKAKGVTPLYYAISEAIKQFPDGVLGKRVKRHIVVLTDGEDNPYGPRGDREPKNIVKLKEIIDQLKAAQKNQVYVTQLDMIAMGIDQKKASDLMEIVAAGHGSYREARKDSIENTLRELLGIPKVLVQMKNVENVLGELGDSMVVKPSSPSAVGSIHLIDGKQRPLLGGNGKPIKIEDIELEGDEALVLEATQKVLKQDGNKVNYPTDLHFRRFEHGEKRARHIDHDKYRVNAMAALEDNGNVTFGVAIQLRDLNVFTKRPKNFWAEVRPLVNGQSNDDVYYFYDPKFRKNEQVPVFELTASDWPPEARSAHVSFWFVEPGRSVKLEQIRIPSLEEKEEIKYGENLKFRFEMPTNDLKNRQLIVNEIHSATSDNFPLFLRIGGLPLESIYHAYGPAKLEAGQPREISHEFTFKNEISNSNQDRTLTLEFAKNQAIRGTAVEDKQSRVKELEFTLEILR